MKTLLTSSPLSSAVTTTTASGALRIISAQQLKLAPGQRITMQVHREGNGIFTLSDGKQTITVEGLPNTISNGARITIFQGSKGDKMLRWVITADSKKAADSVAAAVVVKRSTNITHIPVAILNEQLPQSEHKRRITKGGATFIANGETKKQSQKILAAIKTGTALTGKVVEHNGTQMTLQLSIIPNRSDKSSVYQKNNPIANTPLQLTTAAIPDKQLGETITASLQRDQNGSPLLLVASDKSMATTQRIERPSLAERMQPGERAIGLVQQKLTDGQLRIGVRGTEIISPPPPNKLATVIKVGDGLMLRMQAGSPTATPTVEIRQHLPNILPLLQQNIRQLLPDAPLITKAIAALRGTSTPLATQLSPAKTDQHQALEAWLQRAQHDNSTPITGPRIAALIRDSGQLLEHKLLQLAQQTLGGANGALDHDLKAVLSKIAANPSATTTPQQQQSPPSTTSQQQQSPPSTTSQQQQSPPSTTPAAPATPSQQQPPHQQLAHRAAEAAQQGVQRIESGQMHAALSAIHHEPMRVEFPMVVFNQLVTVQMAVTEQYEGQHLYNKEQKENGKSFNILMALNLSHLGEVRIDSNISNTAVFASIHIASDAAAQFARPHLHRLINKMQAAGFTQVQIVIANQPPNPEKEQAFTQLTAMVPTTTNLLDIEI